MCVYTCVCSGSRVEDVLRIPITVPFPSTASIPPTKCIFSLFYQILSDLGTYLHKAIPDTKLTIKKYLDVKFEYLSYCLKVKVRMSVLNANWVIYLCCM